MASMIRIPDELFRQAQAEAARRGVAVEELVAQALRERLSGTDATKRRIEFPILRSNEPPSISPDDVNRALEQDYRQEDFERGRTP